jgi:hypothetical protein
VETILPVVITTLAGVNLIIGGLHGACSSDQILLDRTYHSAGPVFGSSSFIYIYPAINLV